MHLERDFEDGAMVKYITVQELRESGLLWFINTILHAFGIAITVNTETGELKAAIVKFRGFNPDTNDLGYLRLTEYMRDNAAELRKDCDD